MSGVPEGQLLLGQMCLDDGDQRQALHWFERAAVGGNLMAVNMVGRCLEHGWGVDAPDPERAAEWYRRAAEHGLDWGMYNLATLLTLGRGVAEDRKEAIGWIQRAAALGHVKSINLLGGFYEDGWEVPQSRIEARQCYEIAARGGDFRAQFNFARFLAEEGDVEGALEWLRKVPETATPAFIEKATAFLMESPVAALRMFARQGLRGEVRFEQPMPLGLSLFQ